MLVLKTEALAQEVLGEKVQVKALMAKATLQCKNLDEITDTEELAAAFKQQCAINAPNTSIRL